MNVVKGLVLLFVLFIFFGMVVVPTYMQMTNTTMWTSGGMLLMPGWMLAIFKLMPVIAIGGLLYGIYRHFAKHDDKPKQNWPNVQ